MMNAYMTKLGFLISVALAGCGGGGSTATTNATTSPPPAASTAIPDGLYAGTTSNGRTLTGLVLDDGTYYVLYSVMNNPGLIAGVIQGTGTALSGTFTSSNGKDINLEGIGVLSTTVSANYVPATSLNGSVSYPSLGQTTTFAATYDKKYETTPSLSTVAGTYSGTAGAPTGTDSTTMTISSSGAVSGRGASGCTFTGTATPRAKGNVYNATITFGGAPCLFPKATVTGGAYFDSSTKRLYAVGITSARDSGFIFSGTKP